MNDLAMTCRSIGNQAYHYYNCIPNNTASEAIQAFAISFVVGTIFSGNVAVGALHGTTALTATSIHGFVSPLFQTCVNPRQFLTWPEEMLRSSFALVSTSLLASAAGYKAPLQILSTTITINAVMNALFQHRCNVNRAHVIYP